MKKVLFVCTGNTCRSPMAQAIFNLKCGPDFISDSAGISTSNGKPVSENSVIALKNIGIEISHSSQQITRDIAEKYDYIVGITTNHANILQNIFPDLKNKIYTFPIEISDPYGMSLSEYEKCRDKISEGIDLILDEIK